MKKLVHIVISIFLSFLFLFITSCSYVENLFNISFYKDSDDAQGETDTKEEIEEPIKEDIDGELSIHFLTLGNSNSGDCIYIRAGECDIIVDGGSKTNSIDKIQNYLSKYNFDGVFEYGIITHAHEDHIACFSGDKTHQSLFDLYNFNIIIDFPLTESKSQIYTRYLEKRNAEIESGAKRYSALDCYNNQNGGARIYNISSSISLEILYNYFYENDASTENNYSVCFMLRYNSKQFLFTGDLESNGEKKLAELYDFTEVELFKAGHHGSVTSSSEALLCEIKPRICVVTAVAGNSEYTTNIEKMFPSQEFVDRIAPYTDKVYVTTLGSAEDKKYYTDMNGDIVVSVIDGETVVNCSNNNTILKDTEWFNANRIMPESWIS